MEERGKDDSKSNHLTTQAEKCPDAGRPTPGHGTIGRGVTADRH
ncbi:MAG: hypothetical protein RL479_528 [Verrucomicrobiota bacterium]